MRLPVALRSNSGFSLIELLISMGIMLVLLSSIAAIMAYYSQWQSGAEGKSQFVSAMADLKKMMVPPEAALAPNVNCRSTFGTQAIDSVNPQQYNLYNPDGSVRFYGDPSPTQNLIAGQWRVTKVKLSPVGTTTYYDSNNILLFANLILSARGTQVSDATADETIPLTLVLSKGLPHQVLSCSSGSVTSETMVVNLPTCSPGQHLTYVQTAVGQQPVWVCQ